MNLKLIFFCALTIAILSSTVVFAAEDKEAVVVELELKDKEEGKEGEETKEISQNDPKNKQEKEEDGEDEQDETKEKLNDDPKEEEKQEEKPNEDDPKPKQETEGPAPPANAPAETKIQADIVASGYHTGRAPGIQPPTVRRNPAPVARGPRRQWTYVAAAPRRLADEKHHRTSPIWLPRPTGYEQRRPETQQPETKEPETKQPETERADHKPMRPRPTAYNHHNRRPGPVQYVAAIIDGPQAPNPRPLHNHYMGRGPARGSPILPIRVNMNPKVRVANPYRAPPVAVKPIINSPNPATILRLEAVNLHTAKKVAAAPPTQKLVIRTRKPRPQPYH